MKRGCFYVLPVLILLSTACQAGQDFYGIQIKNEWWAKNLVLGEVSTPATEYLIQESILSHAIRAEASFDTLSDGRTNFRVNLINDTALPISSDYRNRDFFIYTKHGQKYPLIDMQSDSSFDSIKPKSALMFAPSFGNLKIKDGDVKMISCSFDLGKTEIFLFPWSQKEKIDRLKNPMPMPKKVASPPLPKAIPNHARRTEIKKSQPGDDGAIDSPVISRREAKVIDVNKKYQFITIDLGAKDGLKQGVMLTVLRSGKTVAKAKVGQIRKTVAVAMLLPETVQDEVQLGDKIVFV